MMSKKRTIEQSALVPADPSQVYRMLTNSTHLREWLADTARAQLQVGGSIYLAWYDGYNTSGAFTQLEPDKKVGFTWRGTGEQDDTEVEIELDARDDGTEVIVRHMGFGNGKKHKRNRKALTRAWKASLENLTSVLETGEDLRFTRRPMLGIVIGREIDAVRAAALGMELTYGVELSGVVPGMKAESSGLRAGDALVKVGDVDVTGFGALATALQPHRAGDLVPIVFYRNGEEHRTDLELSARPLPDIPQSASALAEILRDMNAKLNASLRDCLEGVSEEAAGRKPAADEWSAKEVLAHLLNEEGDSHAWIIELLIGAERDYDAPFGNSDLRTAVTAWSYHEWGQMLSALELLQEQTVSLVSQLPAEFEAQRSSFWRLAYNFATRSDHYDEHLDQIRAALAPVS
jgi:uncharacterized protein YndB with AHSA1/START domain